MCVRLWWPIGKEIIPPIAHVALLHKHIGIVCCWKGITELELDMVCHWLEMGGRFNFVASVKLMHA